MLPILFDSISWTSHLTNELLFVACNATYKSLCRLVCLSVCLSHLVSSCFFGQIFIRSSLEVHLWVCSYIKPCLGLQMGDLDLFSRSQETFNCIKGQIGLTQEVYDLGGWNFLWVCSYIKPCLGLQMGDLDLFSRSHESFNCKKVK